VLVVVSVQPVAADESISWRIEREVEHEPYLTIDPMLRSNFEGLTHETERHSTDVIIGDTRVILEGIATQNVDTPERVTEDVASRGWRAAVRMTRKLGPLDLEAWASVDNIQTRYGRGTYRDVGVALVKRFSLSRWMKAWISLSLSNRQWLDDKPPDGEANGTSLMLSIGTTFR